MDFVQSYLPRETTPWLNYLNLFFADGELVEDVRTFIHRAKNKLLWVLEGEGLVFAPNARATISSGTVSGAKNGRRVKFQPRNGALIHRRRHHHLALAAADVVDAASVGVDRYSEDKNSNKCQPFAAWEKGHL